LCKIAIISQPLEQRLLEKPAIAIPVIFLQRETDASLPETAVGQELFLRITIKDGLLRAAFVCIRRACSTYVLFIKQNIAELK
jgi:hypothetical protein